MGQGYNGAAMIRRIVLENYMSHARTVIEPAAGLTVLSGPNNCGKSAVVSALQTLCGDNRGDFMVRHGEKLCSVSVETDDGHEITWRRKGGAISYVIDGVEVHRASAANLPDNLHEHLRLAKVEPADGSKAFDVHFGVQKAPIFLIDEEGRAASFFSASNDAERLLELQKRHKAKWSEAKGEERRLKGESAATVRKLEALAPLGAVDEAIHEAEARHGALVRLAGTMKRLREMIGRLELAGREAGRLEGRTRVMGDLRLPPAMLDVARIRLQMGRLEGAVRRAEVTRRRRDAVSPLEGPPSIRDTQPLRELVSQWTKATRAARRAEALRTALVELRDAPTRADTEALRKLCERVKSQSREVRKCSVRKAHLDTLRAAPERRETAALASLIDRLEVERGRSRRIESRAKVLWNLATPSEPIDPRPLGRLLEQFRSPLLARDKAGNALRRIEGELKEVEARIDAWVSSNPTCPVCGGVTEREKILAGEHGHE
jgi:exonuclease SbcC